MPDIENYNRKKRKALVTLLVFSAFFFGILMYMGEEGILLMICMALMMSWTNFLVRYEKLSTEIDIFKELESKKGADDTGPQ